MSKYNKLGITLNKSGDYSDVRSPLQVGVELRYGSEVEGWKRSSRRTLASACKKLRPAQNYVVPISKEVGNVGDVGVSRS